MTIEDPTGRLGWLLEEWDYRRPFYLFYRQYYDGEQKATAVSDKYQKWFADLLRKLHLNLCEVVVDAVVDRLEIMSWSSGVAEDPTESTAVAQVWEDSRGPAVMNEVHEGASVEGDAYALVWPDAKGEKKLWPHRGDEMVVWYEPELPDEPYVAGKIWQDYDVSGTKIWRFNAYWSDRVDRYWARHSDSEELPSKLDRWEELTPEVQVEGAFSVPNLGGGDAVPVAHFTPGRRSNSMGKSDLKNAVPIQDALNKGIVDLVVSGEGLALPLRVLTGVAAFPDPATGEMSGPKYDPRKDIWMNVANEQAKLWTATGADVTKLVDGVEHWIVNMARTTKTPPDRLLARVGGAVESGVSRKIADAPLTAKIRTRQQRYDPSWRRTMLMLGHDVIPTWAPATFETEEERLEQAKTKVDIGVPLIQVLTELNYTEDKIKEMFRRQEELDSALGGLLVRAFRDGRDPAALINGEAE